MPWKRSSRVYATGGGAGDPNADRGDDEEHSNDAAQFSGRAVYPSLVMAPQKAVEAKPEPVTFDPKTERRIRANDQEYNGSFQYANNYISTSKYNAFTFVPRNLFEQFQRIANAYFLFLLILQLIPAISSLTWVTTVIPLGAVLALTALKDAIDDVLVPQVSSLTPLTTVIPLVAVLAVSAIKDAVDDLQRHRSDNQVNNRRTWVLRSGKLVEERWHKIMVGDIIKMENNQFVAADLLLLSTSEPNSLLYIETAELDGETNLKVKQALPDTAKMEDDLAALNKFDGECICEAPNNRLSKFEGLLKWNNEKYSLDNDKLLLRGCVLRNTRWCYGLVIFAGKDTKLMMNCGNTTLKRTHIDRLMNLLIIGIFIFLLSVCLICTVCCGVWESMIGHYFQDYLPWESFVPDNKAGGSTVIALLVFLSYIIILNTVVPISLYVSVEMIRFGHSYWINWDEKMYYAKNDTPARARTTTLNEELGQIEYIFSDKTGTLTQNIMTFNKCSINGKAYGDPVDAHGNLMDVTTRTPKVDFSDNPMYESSFDFYDGRLLRLVVDDDRTTHQFFRLLALCHTVMPEENNGQLEYQAQSPDENALVSAARNFGFVFRSRTPNSITITVNGETEEYELLCILDFNNVRKRMSVIVKKENKIVLYMKGADSMVFERLDRSCDDLKELTLSHLNDFAQDGLRTLCLAEKVIDPQVYAEWSKRHHEASTSMEDRDDKLDAVYEEIEQNMILLGATAIEDKLQDGVPQAIDNLATAGIKIWVLTGDKQETAINIGYSCKLLTDDLEEMYVVDGETYEEVRDQLQKAYQEMIKISQEGGHKEQDLVAFSNGGGETVPEIKVSDECGGFAIVLNGHSLVHGLTESMEQLLLDTGCMCKAVICCRVTPLQKAMVVDLIKRYKKTITLAIGDGANDVSMIKTAHIGVGISGMEGMQAVLASDFSVAQFRFLERLLLVHGRWSYFRMCKFLKYFFYKNFAFTLCHFWYAFFCGFSAQTLYDPYFISFYNVFFTSLPVLAMGIFDQTLFDEFFITFYNVLFTSLPVLGMGFFDKTLYDEAFISLYNVCYTSLPILALGIFDQDVNDESSVRYPKLYTPGHMDLLFNKKVFAQSVAEGIITSLVLFFIPYGAFHDAIKPDGTDLVGHKAFGCVVASTLIVAVTLRCALDTSYWTGFNHVVVWGSIFFYFGFTFVFYSDLFIYEYVGTARNVMSTANFWFTLILTVTVLLVPVVAERFYYIDTRPTLTDKVRLKQKISKTKSKSGEFILRRHSTMRRSQRSLYRSGYAFAHQEGFGKLITTGANMPKHRRNAGSAASVQPGSHPSSAASKRTVDSQQRSHPSSAASARTVDAAVVDNSSQRANTPVNGEVNSSGVI